MSVMDGVQSAFQSHALSRVTRQRRVERNSFLSRRLRAFEVSLGKSFLENPNPLFRRDAVKPSNSQHRLDGFSIIKKRISSREK